MSEKLPRKSSQGLDKALEAEIAAALADTNMFDLEAPADAASDDAGHKTGTIVDIGDSDVLVEFNARQQGTCPIGQFAKPPVVGDKHPFVVEREDRASGLMTLSLGRHAASHVEWVDLEVGRLVKAKCTGHNQGGLEVKISGHRGFIPWSQVALERVEDGDQFVDKSLDCQVIEVDREKNRIILSRRAVLEVEREEARAATVSTLSVGDTVPGEVTRIEAYGAFVDIGGIEGLLHVSQMDYQRVENPGDYVEIGQKVEVQILKVENNGERISLGLKQLKADPWDDFVAFNSVGSMVSGKVTRIAEFGAFVELAPGLEGLIHIGQLAPHRVSRVRAVVAEGDQVSVRVAVIEPERRRIGLSMLTEKGRMIGDESEVDDDTIQRFSSSRDSSPAGSNLGALLREALSKKDEE